MIAVLRHIALLVADEPELAGAVTNALLGKDAEVMHLRLRIGREIHQRLVTALGRDCAPDMVESLNCSTREPWCVPAWDMPLTPRSPTGWKPRRDCYWPAHRSRGTDGHRGCDLA